MRARRAVRTVGAVALLTPLAGVVTGGAPAFASGESYLSPTPAADSVISSGSSVGVKASINRGTSNTTIRLVGPGGFDTNYTWSCPSSLTNSNPCASTAISASLSPGDLPRANGGWTVTLNGGFARRFYTNFAPGTPTGLSAKGTGASQVDLSWSYGGSEPDPAGFVIADDKGNSFTVIDPSARSYTTYYTNPDPGTYDYSFTVRALRKSGGCGACGDTVSGSPSGSASAQLVTPVPPPPPPSPTPGPTTTGGTTGDTGGGTTGTTTGGSTGTSGTTTGSTTGSTTGTTTGGSTGSQTTTGTTGAQSRGTTGKPKPAFSIPTLSPQAAQRRAFALGFNNFSPSLGIPKLPPLPATKFPVTASEDPGTYQPTLPYDPEKEVTATDVFTDPVGVITNLDSDGLWRSVAMAMILMLVAAHVRIFLGKATG